MRARMSSMFLAVGAIATVALVAPAVPASAGGEGPPMTVVGPSTPACTQQTVTFEYAGFQAREFVVPTGVTQVTVDAYGAQGGAGNASANGVAAASVPGGLGGRATTALAVTPGETLEVRVGGRGSDDMAATTANPWVITSAGIAGGGFNGGGSGNGEGFGGGQGATMAGIAGGGGGGGASDVRQGGSTLADRVVVGPGGGGGGSASVHGLANQSTSTSQAGGAGAAGGSGLAGTDGTGTTAGTGGGAGTLVAAGVAGVINGFPAVNDQGGQGGLGGGVFGNTQGLASGGGGGGGGWFGGGGGGSAPFPNIDHTADFGGAGGGGGGSAGPAGVTSAPGVRSGDGLVVFTYTTSGCPEGETPAATDVSVPAKLTG